MEGSAHPVLMGKGLDLLLEVYLVVLNVLWVADMGISEDRVRE